MFYGGEILDGTYQIIKNIGKGGTGVIYKAYHMRLKKYVVVNSWIPAVSAEKRSGWKWTS